jgi:hypothetical protein
MLLIVCFGHLSDFWWLNALYLPGSNVGLGHWALRIPGLSSSTTTSTGYIQVRCKDSRFLQRLYAPFSQEGNSHASIRSKKVFFPAWLKIWPWPILFVWPWPVAATDSGNVMQGHIRHNKTSGQKVTMKNNNSSLCCITRLNCGTKQVTLGISRCVNVRITKRLRV